MSDIAVIYKSHYGFTEAYAHWLAEDLSADLLEAGKACGGVLEDKLYDLALLAGMYDSVVSEGHTDPTDRLTRLAERIPDADMGGIRVYIDGFTDFTRQQRNILSALLDAGCDLTVCLTCDPREPGMRCSPSP